MTDTTIHRFLTPALMLSVLQEVGYRVEEIKGPDGVPALRSATGGLGFNLLFSNPLPDQAGAYADAIFQAAFQVRGELPLSLVNTWNVAHRFARLNMAQNLLVLDMDVLALGGVHADNLRSHAEIWDRLVQQLIAYLRDELPKLAPHAEPAPAEAEAEAPAEAASGA